MKVIAVLTFGKYPDDKIKDVLIISDRYMLREHMAINFGLAKILPKGDNPSYNLTPFL